MLVLLMFIVICRTKYFNVIFQQNWHLTCRFSAFTNMDFKNMKAPKVPVRGIVTLLSVGVVGGLGVYGLNNGLYNVEGGSQAIVFNRITGLKNKVMLSSDSLLKLLAILFFCRCSCLLVKFT